MCVTERERERERVCVYEREREREIEREREPVGARAGCLSGKFSNVSSLLNVLHEPIIELIYGKL